MSLTVAEIGAFLGITPSAVRQIVRRKSVEPTGKRGKALTYDPHEVIRHAGTHDRRKG